MNKRSLNWINSAGRSLAAAFPELYSDDCLYLTERVCSVLLQRLPPDVSLSLIALLPENHDLPAQQYTKLLIAARQEPDLSIGYPAMVDQVIRSVHEPKDLHARQEMLQPDYFNRVTDYVLWAFATEIPSDLKVKLSDHLPVDIRTRMNLYSGQSEEAKVA
jgi:hypothetical protein